MLKHEIPNHKIQAMIDNRSSKRYDLEERTLNFAKKVIGLCKKVPKNTINYELVGQVVRSSGSVGANYREANEALSKKDFIFRMKICRKEAKETGYWLQLLDEGNPDFGVGIEALFKESVELRKIFSSIIEKSR